MNDSLLIAVLAGLGGMIGWGFGDFFAKTAIDRIGPIKSLVWAHCFGTLVFVLVALFKVAVLGDALGLPQSGGDWAGVIFFGALQMIVYWLAYEGFSKGQLAVLNPVFASYSGVVAIVAAIAFHEHLGWLMAVALVGIFVGILLLNVDLPGLRSKKLNIVPGLKEMGLAALLAAIWTLGWDKFVTDKDPVSYALLMYFFMTLAAIGLARLMRVKVKGRESVLWKPLALVGLCEAIAYLCISWGYSATSLTGVVALISGAFSLPTIILARLFLKERITTLQTIAVGIIIVSLIVVAVS